MQTVYVYSEQDEKNARARLEGLDEGYDYQIERKFKAPGEASVPAPATKLVPQLVAQPRTPEQLLPDLPTRQTAPTIRDTLQADPAMAESTARPEGQAPTFNPLEGLGDGMAPFYAQRVKAGVAERQTQARQQGFVQDPLGMGTAGVREILGMETGRKAGARQQIRAEAQNLDLTPEEEKEEAVRLLAERYDARPAPLGGRPVVSKDEALRMARQALDTPQGQQVLRELRVAGVGMALQGAADAQDTEMLDGIGEAWTRSLAGSHLAIKKSLASFGVLDQAGVDQDAKDYEDYVLATPAGRHGFLHDTAITGAEILGPMAESLVAAQMLAPAGAVAGATGSVLSKLGKAGRLMTATGRAAKVSPYWFAVSQGESYDRMRKAGLTDKEALAASIPIGVLVGKIEQLQTEQALDFTSKQWLNRKLLYEFPGSSAARKVGGFVAGRAGTAVLEAGEEAAQSITEDVATNFATWLHNEAKKDGIPLKSLSAVMGDGLNAFKSTFAPMLMIGVGAGSVGEAGQAAAGVLETRKQRAQDALSALQIASAKPTLPGKQPAPAAPSIVPDPQLEYLQGLGQRVFEAEMALANSRNPEAAAAVEDLLASAFDPPTPRETQAPAAPQGPLQAGEEAILAPRTVKGKPVGESARVSVLSVKGATAVVQTPEGEKTVRLARLARPEAEEQGPEPAAFTLPAELDPARDEQTVLPQGEPGQAQPVVRIPQELPLERRAVAEMRARAETPTQELPPAAAGVDIEARQAWAQQFENPAEMERLSALSDEDLAWAASPLNTEQAPTVRAMAQMVMDEREGVVPEKLPKLERPAVPYVTKPEQAVAQEAPAVQEEAEPEPVTLKIEEEAPVPKAKRRRGFPGYTPNGTTIVIDRITEYGGIKGRPKGAVTAEYDGAPIPTELGGFARFVYGGREAADIMAQNLFDDGLISDPSPDTMWEAIRKNVAAYRGDRTRSAKQRAEEAAADKAYSKWVKSGSEVVSVDDLKKGDRFTIQGEKFRVTGEGDTSLTVQDGRTYNIPYEARGDENTVRVDKGSVKRVKRKVYPVDPDPFDIPALEKQALRDLSNPSALFGSLQAIPSVFKLAQAYIQRGASTFPKFVKAMRDWAGDKPQEKGSLRELFNTALRVVAQEFPLLTKAALTAVDLRRAWQQPSSLQARKLAKRAGRTDPELQGKMEEFINQFHRGQETGVDRTMDEDVELLKADYVIPLMRVVAEQMDDWTKARWATLLRKRGDDGSYPGLQGTTEERRERKATLDKVRKILDDLGAELHSRGAIGKPLPNYVPRSYDPEKVATVRNAQGQTFAEFLAQEALKTGRVETEEEAEAYGENVAQAIIQGREGLDPLDKKFAKWNAAAMGPGKADMLKARELDYIDDQALILWLHENHEYGLFMAMNRMVNSAEWARRVGKGQYFKLREQMKKVLPSSDIEQFDKILAGWGGRFHELTPWLMNTKRYVFDPAKTLVTVMTMAPVVAKSMAEFGMPLVRSASIQDPVATLKHQLNMLGWTLAAGTDKAAEKAWRAIGRDYASKSETRRIARDIGLFVHGYMQELMTRRDIGDPNVVEWSDRMIGKFYRWNGLEFVTRTQRLMATATAMSFINHGLRTVASAKSGSARHARHMGFLAELGSMDQAKAERLLAYVEGKGTEEGRSEYASMVLRFVNETIMDPTRQDRPMLANSKNPFIQALYQFQGYGLAARNKIISRIGKQAGQGNVGPLIAAALPIYLGYLTQKALQMLLGGDDDDEDKSEFRQVVDTVLYSGMAGTLSSPAMWYTGMTEWGRTPVDFGAGAFYGFFGKEMTRMARFAANDPSWDEFTRQTWNALPVVRNFPPLQDKSGSGQQTGRGSGSGRGGGR